MCLGHITSVILCPAVGPTASCKEGRMDGRLSAHSSLAFPSGQPTKPRKEGRVQNLSRQGLDPSFQLYCCVCVCVCVGSRFMVFFLRTLKPFPSFIFQESQVGVQCRSLTRHWRIIRFNWTGPACSALLLTHDSHQKRTNVRPRTLAGWLAGWIRT